jgi:hypothetical protein
MGRVVGGILLLFLGMSVAAGDKGGDKPATPAEQYQALAMEFQEAVNGFYLKATTDEERVEPQARIAKLSPRFLELAEKNPKDPVGVFACGDDVQHLVALAGHHALAPLARLAHGRPVAGCPAGQHAVGELLLLHVVRERRRDLLVGPARDGLDELPRHRRVVRIGRHFLTLRS